MNYSNLEKETTKKIDILMLFRLQLSQDGNKNQIRDDLELIRFEAFFEMTVYTLHVWQNKRCHYLNVNERYNQAQQ